MENQRLALITKPGLTAWRTFFQAQASQKLPLVEADVISCCLGRSPMKSRQFWVDRIGQQDWAALLPPNASLWRNPHNAGELKLPSQVFRKQSCASLDGTPKKREVSRESHALTIGQWACSCARANNARALSQVPTTQRVMVCSAWTSGLVDCFGTHSRSAKKTTPIRSKKQFI